MPKLTTPFESGKNDVSTNNKQPSIPLPSRYFADICFIADAFNLAEE